MHVRHLIFAWLASLCVASYASSKETVVLAWSDYPRSFDPRYAVDADSQYMENLLHCSLIDFDAAGEAFGYLARSWEWATPKTLKIQLNPAATFGDGSKVTSADVKASLGFYLRSDLKRPTPRAGAFSLVDHIDIAGPQVVTIHLKEPDSTFVVNALWVGILPKSATGDETITAKSGLKGCGPFVLKDAGLSQINLERNANYALGTKPKIANVQIKVVKDEGTRFAKLQAGEVDIVQNGLSYEKLANIDKDYPALKILKRPGLRTTYIGFNFRDSVLKHRRVRQAIAKSINKDAIIRYILKGLATKANTLLAPDNSFYPPSPTTQEFNPKLAARLLDEAGFKPKGPQGIRFRLTYKTTQNQTRVAIGRAIAADLRKVGIDVRVQALEWGRFKDDVEKGRVQMWGLTWIGFKDPDIYRYAFASESFPPNGGNRGRFHHRELDQLAARARTETNQATRKQLYHAIQKIIGEELPYVFLWHDDVYAVVHQQVHAFNVFADGRYGALKTVYKR